MPLTAQWTKAKYTLGPVSAPGRTAFLELNEELNIDLMCFLRSEYFFAKTLAGQRIFKEEEMKMKYCIGFSWLFCHLSLRLA